MTDDRPKVGVAVFIRRDNQILLGFRRGAHAGECWCPPGGHLEHGEDWTDCARRETLEECGLTIRNPRLAFVTNDLFDSGRHYITLHLVADHAGGEPAVNEPDRIDSWQWFSRDALPAPLMLSTQNALSRGFSPFCDSPGLQPC